MCNEKPIYISDKTRAVLRELSDDYLADVLRVWDCNEQKWADGPVWVLRFESDDLLVWKDGDALHCKRGSVDTDGTEIMQREEALGMHENIGTDACFCWRPDTTQSRFIGEKGPDLKILKLLL